MKLKTLLLVLTSAMIGCTSNSPEKKNSQKSSNHNVLIAGSMIEAVWKGELFSKIDLDTIKDKTGLYGLGPITYMRGEITINDGEIWVSRVLSEDSSSVNIEDTVSAPFLVYSNVTEWDTIPLPSTLKSIPDLEKFIDNQTHSSPRPFAFKILGSVDSATIHIQNLPIGAKVSNPKEAHAGQKKYHITSCESEIIGFFSTDHQGVFTHHDSYLHMHLLTQDRTHMGHLDELAIKEMSLLLPKE